MTANRKDRALRMTVAEFCAKHKLSGQDRNTLAKDNDAKTFTMHEVLSSTSFWKSYQDRHNYVGVGKDGITNRMTKFTEALVSYGFSTLDYAKLPASSVTIKQFRAFGKTRVRLLDVRALNTLTNAAIRLYEELLGIDMDKPLTIGDLLELNIGSENSWKTYRLKGFRRSIAKTREKLVAIGFRYEDGAFMQQGTRREFVEKLMIEGTISRKAAQRVAELAARKGWVPKFIE